MANTAKIIPATVLNITRLLALRITSYDVYEPVQYGNTDMYYNKYVGSKYEPKTVKQFIYRMTNAQGCQPLQGRNSL